MTPLFWIALVAVGWLAMLLIVVKWIQGAILEIEFRNGRTYRYFNVSEFLYRGLALASSKGQYFTQRIDGRFRFEEVQ